MVLGVPILKHFRAGNLLKFYKILYSNAGHYWEGNTYKCLASAQLSCFTENLKMSYRCLTHQTHWNQTHRGLVTLLSASAGSFYNFKFEKL